MESTGGFKLVSSRNMEDKLAESSSLYSEPCYDNDTEVSGIVKVGVWHQDEEQILCVRIAYAKELATFPGKDTNPYAKIHLLIPDCKPIKRKTGIHKKTTRPKFDEIVKYKLAFEELSKATLRVSMWSWELLGRNKFLGEVKLPLSSKDLDLSDIKCVKYKLMDHEADETDGPISRGRLCIAVKFKLSSTHSYTGPRRRSRSLSPPSSPIQNLQFLKPILRTTTMCMRSPRRQRKTVGTLSIHVKAAKDLYTVDSTGDPNPFVRCYLLPDTTFGEKRKTSVLKKTPNPIWNNELRYNQITLPELCTKRVLEVTVWDQDRRGTNSFIGGLRLGPNPCRQAAGERPSWMDSVGTEASQWEDMLENVGEWVESWHDLRPSMNSLYIPCKAEEQLQGPDILDLSLWDEPPMSELQESNEQAMQELGIDPSHEDSSTLSEQVELEDNQLLTIPSEMNLSRREKGDHYEISGEVVLGLTYEKKKLTAKVVRASGLAAVNVDKNYSDPYVKLYLLPDKSSEKKTKTQKKTLNPTYNQTFQYTVTEADLKNSSLWVSVWSNVGIFKYKSYFLGEICIAFDTYKFKESLEERSYKLTDFSKVEMIPNPNAARRGSTTYHVCTSAVGKPAKVPTLYDSSSDFATLDDIAMRNIAD